VSADVDARGLVEEFMRVLKGAEEAALRSVLDGTISCRECRALVLESNADGHAVWHLTVAAAILNSTSRHS
jgi:hypothetical protein